MGAIGYFLAIWLGAMFLKIIGVPGFKDIKWRWFILAPILYPIIRVLVYVIGFCFFAALGFAVCYYGAQAIIWIYAQ